MNRRDYQADSGKAKALARKKYAERQIKKWVDWSWRQRGRVIYKELIEQIEKYERK
jgi:bisphosphoglycerate-dependent phosphoglycerate mutase